MRRVLRGVRAGVRGLRARLRDVVFRRSADRAMDEEIAFHLEMEAELHFMSGLDPAEARRRALIAFGGVERYRESLRDERRLPFLEAVRDDVRAGVRSMARAPVLSLLAAFTIALGVGATTIMLSTINALFVRPLAIPNAERLASIQE